VDEARSRLGGGFRHGTGATRLHRIELLAAGLVEDADAVDDDLGAGNRLLHRIGIPQIGLHGMDLPDRTERLEVTGEIGAANRDADTEAPAGERPHHVPSDESRATEDGDEAVVGLHLRGPLEIAGNAP